jgi:signal transduction histidine kinase
VSKPLDEVNTLKVIAETLNRSNDMKPMLQQVLEQLLDVTELSTGWIFLVNEDLEYSFIASHQLPPALRRNGCEPMCSGNCYCLSKYRKGELNQPVNIINCRRIEKAALYNWGDTLDITHHATIPLSAGGERFGVLNVAAPNKQTFDAHELDLLQSVAYQIGTAINRIRLFEAQEKQADDYVKLDEMSRALWPSTDRETLCRCIIKKTKEIFHIEQCAALLLDDQQANRMTVYSENGTEIAKYTAAAIPLQNLSEKRNYFILKDPDISQVFPFDGEAFYIPVKTRGTLKGYLVIQTEKKTVEITPEVLNGLVDHIGLTLENINLQEKRQELQLLDERNRLARDLHDAVSQKLFSLSLTAQGALSLISSNETQMMEALTDIKGLAKGAMSEMKAMIWQLRPHGLENGLISAVKVYAESLDIHLTVQYSPLISFSSNIKEAIWRILQEALNNIHKHAKTQTAELRIEVGETNVTLTISDHGIGFNVDESKQRQISLGLTSMKERVEALNGRFKVISESGKGTLLIITIPLQTEKEGMKDVD